MEWYNTSMASRIKLRFRCARLLHSLLGPTIGGRFAIGILAGATCLCGAALGQIPCRYEISAIIQAPPCPIIGPTPTVATGISPSGEYVCGFWYQCFNSDKRAFLYLTDAQQFITLPHPAGVVSSYAWDVSDEGLVVGDYEVQVTPTLRRYRGYVYNLHSAQYTELQPVDPSHWSHAVAVNSNGVVCGHRGTPWQPFLWTARAGFRDLDLRGTQPTDINDSEWVPISTGHSIDPGAQALLWTPERLFQLGFVPSGYSSQPSNVNNHGQILVGGLLQTSPIIITAGFVYDHGTWTHLPPLPGHVVAGGSDIGENGLVVGYSRPEATPALWRACLWSDGQPKDLHALLVSNPAGLTLEAARGISRDGRIVVSVRHPMSPYGALLTPVATVPGDTDCNALVNTDDLLKVIVAWGPCMGCTADLNSDQNVNINDLLLVIDNWTEGQLK